MKARQPRPSQAAPVSLPGKPGSNSGSIRIAPPPHPLTPRPKLLLALCILLALWIAALMAMYFLTIFHAKP